MRGASAVRDRLAWDKVVFVGGVIGAFLNKSVRESLAGDFSLRWNAMPFTKERYKLINERMVKEISMVLGIRGSSVKNVDELCEP